MRREASRLAAPATSIRARCLREKTRPDCVWQRARAGSLATCQIPSWRVDRGRQQRWWECPLGKMRPLLGASGRWSNVVVRALSPAGSGGSPRQVRLRPACGPVLGLDEGAPGGREGNTIFGRPRRIVSVVRRNSHPADPANSLGPGADDQATGHPTPSHWARRRSPTPRVLQLANDAGDTPLRANLRRGAQDQGRSDRAGRQGLLEGQPNMARLAAGHYRPGACESLPTLAARLPGQSIPDPPCRVAV